MNDDILSTFNNADCLFDREAVENVIKTMAVEISEKLSDKEPIVLTIMNGGLIFSGHLVSHLTCPLQIDYCHATRYRGEMTGSELHWKVLPQMDLEDRCVLIVDDIYDEGHTLMSIIRAIKSQGANEVYTAVLLDKEHNRKADPAFKADFTGFTVPDQYVFGFGMDYRDYLRNAPGIFSVKK